MDMQMLMIRPFSVRSLAVRSLVVAAALAGALAFGAMTAQHASAAGLDGPLGDPTAVAQTVPEPAPPQPGEGEGVTPGQTLPEGESAVADGGSATPWIAAGVGVLLVLALAGAVWASRKPSAMDLEGRGTAADPTMSEQRYIPPGF